MWLSELEKGMTVWMYGLHDTWNIYQGTVKGWSGSHAYLDCNGKHVARLIEQISAEPLESRPIPEGVIEHSRRLFEEELDES